MSRPFLAGERTASPYPQNVGIRASTNLGGYVSIRVLAGPSAGKIVKASTSNDFDYSLSWPWQTKRQKTVTSPFGYLGMGSGGFICGGRTSHFYNEERTNIKLTRSELLGGDGSAVEITKYWEYA